MIGGKKNKKKKKWYKIDGKKHFIYETVVIDAQNTSKINTKTYFPINNFKLSYHLRTYGGFTRAEYKFSFLGYFFLKSEPTKPNLYKILSCSGLILIRALAKA